MQKSVVHLTFSSAGGAGGVAATLSQAQQSLGISSQLVTHITSSLWARPLSAPFHSLAAGLDEYVVKDQRFTSPISLYREKLSTRLTPVLQGADIIHLHGINGFVNLDELRHHAQHKPIVWTLHDMNPFTGACHYSLGCEGFRSQCESCPAVRAPWRHRVTRNLGEKLESAASLSYLQLVTPSGWLRGLVEDSRLMNDAPVKVIDNPIREEFFSTPPSSRGASSTTKFLVIAQNLNDPVKDVTFAINAFSSIRKKTPGAELVLVGKGGESFTGKGIRRIENLSSAGIISELDSSTALIVSSTAENAPLVIAEAASRGCLAVVRNVGGMPDMVKNLGHGHVFETAQELMDILSNLSHEEPPASKRASLRRAAQKLHSPGAAAKAYAKVYEAAIAATAKRKGR